MKYLNVYHFSSLSKFRQEMNMGNNLLLENELNNFLYFEVHLAIDDSLRLLRPILTHDNERNKILSLLR